MEVSQTLPKLISNEIPHAKHSDSTEPHRELQVSENQYQQNSFSEVSTRKKKLNVRAKMVILTTPTKIKKA